jgi:hypothetical protein
MAQGPGHHDGGEGEEVKMGGEGRWGKMLINISERKLGLGKGVVPAAATRMAARCQSYSAHVGHVCASIASTSASSPVASPSPRPKTPSPDVQRSASPQRTGHPVPRSGAGGRAEPSGRHAVWL